MLPEGLSHRARGQDRKVTAACTVTLGTPGTSLGFQIWSEGKPWQDAACSRDAPSYSVGRKAQHVSPKQGLEETAFTQSEAPWIARSTRHPSGVHASRQAGRRCSRFLA